MESVKADKNETFSSAYTRVMLGALLGGLVALAFGVHFDSAILSSIGFVAVVPSLLYLNARLWSGIYRNKSISKDVRNSCIMCS